MQANSQHLGQLQTYRANGMVNNTDHNYFKKGLPPNSAHLSNPGQTNHENYIAQFSCTILQPTSNHTVNGSTQVTNEMQPTQKNMLNSGTLSSGNKNPNIVLWTVPGSSVQVYVPVSNMRLHKTNGASNNNGPSISHCSQRPGTEMLNYNNSACMQQRTTSGPAGTNNSLPFSTQLMNSKNPNDPQGDLIPFTKANASKILPNGPSNSRYFPTTTNASNGQTSSLCGPVYNRLIAEHSSDHTNLQALSKHNFQQNNITKKSVNIVTPLSPIEMASVDFLNKSAYALDTQPSHCQPNFSKPLEIKANLQTTGEPNYPTSKRPKSAEPRLQSKVVTSPVCLLQSTSPEPNIVATEQNRSAKIQKASQRPKDYHKGTDKRENSKETPKYSSIPVIEWPLDKLEMLIKIIHQVEDGQQKNVDRVSERDAGKEILKLYWNGDFCKFCDAMKTGIFQNIMEEVYNYCEKEDEVILRQIKRDARHQVFKDFLVLKHNEVPPNIEYKSSWLNLNDKLDDIERECGVSWHFRCLYSTSQQAVEHEGSSAGQIKHQCSTETTCQNKVLEDEQTIWKSTERTLENERFLPVTDHNHSVTQNIAVPTNFDIHSSISNNVSTPKTISVTLAAVHSEEEALNEVKSAPQEMSYSNPPQKLQRELPDAVCKSPITVSEIGSKTPEVQTSSVHKNTSDSFTGSPNADVNHLPELDVVTEETSQLDAMNALKAMENLAKMTDVRPVFQRCLSAGTSGRARLFGGARKHNKSVTNNASLNLKQKTFGSSQISNEPQVQNSTQTKQSSLLDETAKRQSLSVVKGQTNCHPNAVDDLKSKRNMLRTQKKSDTSLSQMGENEIQKSVTQHSAGASVMPELHNRFSTGSGGRCPILTGGNVCAVDVSNMHLSEISRQDTLSVLNNPNIQSDCTKSSNLNSSSPGQKESSEKLPNDDLNQTKPYPVELLPSPQMQNESKEMPTKDGCCETVEKSDSALYVNPEVFAKDALASKKIAVLPREIAEQCFADKLTKDKDFETSIDVCTSCEDQIDKVLNDNDNQVEVSLHDHSDDEMEIKILNQNDDQIKVLFSEMHAEDIKPLDRTSPGAVDVKLEFYCCLAKWVQVLKHADVSFCMCQLKTEKIEASEISVNIQTKDCNNVLSKGHGCMESKTGPPTNDAYSAEWKKASNSHSDKSHDNDANETIKMQKTSPVSQKTSPVSKEGFKDKEATVRETKEGSTSKCIRDEILKQSVKDNSSPDVKKTFETVCLSLFGSSNKRDGPIRRKRYKDGGRAPPETLNITISSEQKNDGRTSKKRKWDRSIENNDSLNDQRKDKTASSNCCDESQTPQERKTTQKKVTKENFSSTSTGKRFNPRHHLKSSSKKRRSLGTKQVSINSFVIRRRTVSPKSFHLPECIPKSKYELGNPALMPLQDGFGLEFKVLPSSFNFEDRTELQAHTSPKAKNEISNTEDKKAKRRKTSHSPTQGTWSFSHLKAKHIESTDVCSSGSLFKEFKKKYRERKKIVSPPN